MNKKIFSFAGMLVVAIALSACNSGKWTQKDKDDYMSSCISSANKSFEERAMTADAKMVSDICSCTLEKIMVKYKANESSKISTPEGQEWAKATTLECAQATMKK